MADRESDPDGIAVFEDPESLRDIVLLVPDEERRIKLPCSRLALFASEIAVGDYIACPVTGFFEVHAIEEHNPSWFRIDDKNGAQHFESSDEQLLVYRPLTFDGKAK